MRCLSHYKVYTVVGIVWHRYIYIRFGEIRRARVTVMMLNATFNNISVISWLSVLLQGDARVSGENHLPVVCHWQTLSHNVVSITPRHEHYFGWYALIAQVGVNPTTIRPWAQRPFRVCLQWVEARGGIVEHQFKAAFPVVPIDKICGRSLPSKNPVDMNSIFMKLYVTWPTRPKGHIPQKFELVIFSSF
jgi:hypothetical protein